MGPSVGVSYLVNILWIMTLEFSGPPECGNQTWAFQVMTSIILISYIKFAFKKYVYIVIYTIYIYIYIHNIYIYTPYIYIHHINTYNYIYIPYVYGPHVKLFFQVHTSQTIQPCWVFPAEGCSEPSGRHR